MVLALLLTVLSASPELEDGRVAFARLQYAQVIERLQPLSERDGVPVGERVEALDLMARAYLALKKPAQAAAAFEALLVLSPMAEEPTGSPKVRAAFQQAKRARFPARYVKLVRRDTPPDVLEVDVINPWRVPVKVELYEATEGAFEGRALEVHADRVAAALPAGSRGYLRVVGADGTELAALGSHGEPLVGPPGPPPAKADDAPRVEPSPTLTPAATTTPSPVEQPAQPEVSSTRQTVSWVAVLAGLGVALLGGGALVWGAVDLGRADGFPFNGISLTEVSALEASGQAKQIGGGITVGVGLVSCATGLVLLLTEK